MGVQRALLPVLPELFAELDGLGCMPRQVERLLRRAGIGPRHRVLDLACGKGAVSVLLASALGCRVTGVDAYAPFLEDARAAAERCGVSARCRFLQGDVNRFGAGGSVGFDAALMVGLHALPQAAAVLRRLVKRGGLYLVDDAFLDSRRADELSQADGLFTLAQARGYIRALGDEVEAVSVARRESIRRLNRDLYERLRRGAKRIRISHPRLGTELDRFLREQRRQNDLLDGPLRPAVWLVRREL